MKLQIDTTEKTLLLEEEVSLDELLTEVNELPLLKKGYKVIFKPIQEKEEELFVTIECDKCPYLPINIT